MSWARGLRSGPLLSTPQKQVVATWDGAGARRNGKPTTGKPPVGGGILLRAGRKGVCHPESQRTARQGHSWGTGPGAGSGRPESWCPAGPSPTGSTNTSKVGGCSEALDACCALICGPQTCCRQLSSRSQGWGGEQGSCGLLPAPLLLCPRSAPRWGQGLDSRCPPSMCLLSSWRSPTAKHLAVLWGRERGELRKATRTLPRLRRGWLLRPPQSRWGPGTTIRTTLKPNQGMGRGHRQRLLLPPGNSTLEKFQEASSRTFFLESSLVCSQGKPHSFLGGMWKRLWSLGPPRHPV